VWWKCTLKCQCVYADLLITFVHAIWDHYPILCLNLSCRWFPKQYICIRHHGWYIFTVCWVKVQILVWLLSIMKVFMVIHIPPPPMQIMEQDVSTGYGHFFPYSFCFIVVIHPAIQQFISGVLLLSLAPQPSLGLGLLHKIQLNFWRLLNNFLFYRVGLLAPRPTAIPKMRS
jgi:hypothetical protein